MKYYRLEPSYKKSVVEIAVFRRKDEDGNNCFLRKELGWRWGSFLLSVPETEEEIQEFLKERGGYESIQEWLADIYGDEYYITENTTLEEFLLPSTESDFVDITEDYEDAEMIECWDGCWEYWSASRYPEEYTEEEQEELVEQIEEVYAEEYEEGVENLGWEYVDTYFEMHCNPVLTMCDANGEDL